MTVVGNHSLGLCKLPYLDFSEASYANSTPAKVHVFHVGCKKLGIVGGGRSNFLDPIKAMEVSRTTMHVNGQTPSFRDAKQCADGDDLINNCEGRRTLPTVGNSSNIVWQKCSVEKSHREKLLNQKGCVVWITGLSGSGKSTLACALNRTLHARGKLAYILDGDNCRHGLNKDLSFEAEDRAENIRRIGEVAKLFADAGVICIASLIAPFRNERDACRALLPEGEFIEVFMDVPLRVCETRDPKGLYKLARAGKIKSFGRAKSTSHKGNGAWFQFQISLCQRCLERNLSCEGLSCHTSFTRLPFFFLSFTIVLIARMQYLLCILSCLGLQT